MPFTAAGYGRASASSTGWRTFAVDGGCVLSTTRFSSYDQNAHGTSPSSSVDVMRVIVAGSVVAPNSVARIGIFRLLSLRAWITTFGSSAGVAAYTWNDSAAFGVVAAGTTVSVWPKLNST